MITIQFGINCYGTGRKDWKAIILNRDQMSRMKKVSQLTGWIDSYEM